MLPGTPTSRLLLQRTNQSRQCFGVVASYQHPVRQSGLQAYCHGSRHPGFQESRLDQLLLTCPPVTAQMGHKGMVFDPFAPGELDLSQPTRFIALNQLPPTPRLEVEVIAVLLNVSLQLLQDSEFDVTADVLNDFIEAVNYRLDHAVFTADGDADATDGGMSGIFVGGTTVSAASGNTTMETLDFEDVTGCLLGVDSAVLSRPAKWWMHPFILVRMLHIKDGNGRPLFLTANEAPTPAGLGSILGYPVELVEAAPSANTAGSAVAVFGDPAAQIVGVRQDFAFEASDHHKWNAYQRSFRGILRAGTKIRRATALGVLTLAAS